jgi:hypothetical protein
MSFHIKQNDTRPALEAQLFDAENNPINLDMCGVRFHMRDMYDRKEISRPATIVNAAQGQIRVDWQTGDTDTIGIMRCEFEITFTDNTILTVPNDGYFLISIVPELGLG